LPKNSRQTEKKLDATDAEMQMNMKEGKSDRSGHYNLTTLCFPKSFQDKHRKNSALQEEFGHTSIDTLRKSSKRQALSTNNTLKLRAYPRFHIQDETSMN
jgi:hypothetical protein